MKPGQNDTSNHPEIAAFTTCKGIQELRKLKIRSISQLVENLRLKHAELHSWPKASEACGVITADGRPNPGLAYRIAERGYEPGRSETRKRLGLPPVCVQCGQKVRRERHVPEWLTVAVGNLARLESAAGHVPADRVYGRGGRRVEISSSKRRT